MSSLGVVYFQRIVIFKYKLSLLLITVNGTAKERAFRILKKLKEEGNLELDKEDGYIECRFENDKLSNEEFSELRESLLRCGFELAECGKETRLRLRWLRNGEL